METINFRNDSGNNLTNVCLLSFSPSIVEENNYPDLCNHSADHNSIYYCRICWILIKERRHLTRIRVRKSAYYCQLCVSNQITHLFQIYKKSEVTIGWQKTPTRID